MLWKIRQVWISSSFCSVFFDGMTEKSSRIYLEVRASMYAHHVLHTFLCSILKYKNSPGTSQDWTVPQTVDKEKKTPVVDKDSLRGLAPDFNRSEAVFEGNSLKIIEIDILRNELFDLNP